MMPYIDFDLLYSKVKFGHLGFCMGKTQTVDFSEAVVAYDIKFANSNQLNVFFINPKVKVIYWPLSWMPQIQYFYLL